MTQIATVEKILPGGFVEISVPRKSACGHDCEECAGCGMTGAAIHARAKDPVGVRPGQKVVVESATRKILGVVALVYLLPVVGFLLGYFLSEGLAGGGPYPTPTQQNVAYDRHAKKTEALTYTVVREF